MLNFLRRFLSRNGSSNPRISAAEARRLFDQNHEIDQRVQAVIEQGYGNIRQVLYDARSTKVYVGCLKGTFNVHTTGQDSYQVIKIILDRAGSVFRADGYDVNPVVEDDPNAEGWTLHYLGISWRD